MSDRVKQVAAEEAERVKAITIDAVQSQAYIYPFKVSINQGLSGQTDGPSGHFLLHHPQRALATLDLQAGTYN